MGVAVGYLPLFTTQDQRLWFRQGLPVLEEGSMVHCAVSANFNCAVVCQLRHFYIERAVPQSNAKGVGNQHEIYRCLKQADP
jgi:hypothetical protein